MDGKFKHLSLMLVGMTLILASIFVLQLKQEFREMGATTKKLPFKVGDTVTFFISSAEWMERAEVKEIRGSFFYVDSPLMSSRWVNIEQVVVMINKTEEEQKGK